jgi:hypothetical protein
VRHPICPQRTVKRTSSDCGRFLLLPVLVGLSLSFGGCGAEIANELVVVRDSAGITIVENAPDAAARVPRWTVGLKPSLSIGVAEGDAGYEFHRVLDGRLLSDGRIAVLDWGSRQVRLFAPDGRLTGVQGRDGGGPGEYRSPQMLWVLAGDSVAVYDPRQDRVTVLATDGSGIELARVTAVRRGIMFPLAAGALDGGRRLVVLHRTFDAATPIQPRMGILWALSIDSVASDSLVQVRHGSYGRMPGGEEFGLVAGYPIFGGLSGWAIAEGDRLVHGSGQEYALEVADAGAHTHRIVRWYGPDRTVTDDDVRTWIDSMVARVPPERRPLERRRREATPVADMKPAHGRLLFDSAGRLWVNQWNLWADHLNDSPDWWVFDSEGRMVATARMPEGFRAFDLGDDAVLGSVHDQMGVERVVLVLVTRSDR